MLYPAIIISGNSGAGKSTIVEYLLKKYSNLAFVISACTREKRKNEVHKKDYYFFSKEEFLQKVKENKFLEWEEVYPDRYYGTMQEAVDHVWKNKKNPLFAVDVKGACQLKSLLPKSVLTIFIKSPNISILKQRLEKRQTENDESLQQRLGKIQIEMKCEKDFDFIVINDVLKDTFEKVESIVEDFFLKYKHCS